MGGCAVLRTVADLVCFPPNVAVVRVGQSTRMDESVVTVVHEMLETLQCPIIKFRDLTISDRILYYRGDVAVYTGRYAGHDVCVKLVLGIGTLTAENVSYTRNRICRQGQPKRRSLQ